MLGKIGSWSMNKRGFNTLRTHTRSSRKRFFCSFCFKAQLFISYGVRWVSSIALSSITLLIIYSVINVRKHLPSSFHCNVCQCVLCVCVCGHSFGIYYICNLSPTKLFICPRFLFLLDVRLTSSIKSVRTNKIFGEKTSTQQLRIHVIEIGKMFKIIHA